AVRLSGDNQSGHLQPGATLLDVVYAIGEVMSNVAAPIAAIKACVVPPNFNCSMSVTGDRVFFQAEDGIRHRNVTGVQTCALPISRRLRADGAHARGRLATFAGAPSSNRWSSLYSRAVLPPSTVSREPWHAPHARRCVDRSEERRVGTEGPLGWEGSPHAMPNDVIA